MTKKLSAILAVLLLTLHTANIQEYLEEPSPKPWTTLYRTTYMEQDVMDIK